MFYENSFSKKTVMQHVYFQTFILNINTSTFQLSLPIVTRYFVERLSMAICESSEQELTRMFA